MSLSVHARRVGWILAEHCPRSKRKLDENISGLPQSLHSFSTAKFLLALCEKVQQKKIWRFGASPSTLRAR
jgi:hypothetical protein